MIGNKTIENEWLPFRLFQKGIRLLISLALKPLSCSPRMMYPVFSKPRFSKFTSSSMDVIAIAAVRHHIATRTALSPTVPVTSMVSFNAKCSHTVLSNLLYNIFYGSALSRSPIGHYCVDQTHTSRAYDTALHLYNDFKYVLRSSG